MKKAWKLPLDGAWTLHGRRETPGAVPCDRFEAEEFALPATVPGNIEDALFSAGRIGDPYYSLNAKALRPYEFFEWIYEREFEYDGAERELELRFDGIDCFGTVLINGTTVGESRNALIGHTFRLECGLLRRGINRIAVHLASAVRKLADYPLQANAHSAFPFNYEVTRIRKPAHAWGWDITPRTALGGVFRSVTLSELPEDRLEELFIQTIRLEDECAELRCGFRVLTPALGDDRLRITLDGICGESTFHAESAVWSHLGVLPFRVENPRLWWPRHYGAADLYAVTVRLVRGDEVLAERLVSLGIRTVELRARPVCTAAPEPDFQFIVNGMPIRLFGSNHVPADALHSHDAERIPAILDLACDLECNILRIWGGGIYELPAFYDRCDREGILVWQDFMMGCALYPNDPEFCETIRREAETVVRALRQHPSLALWAGDNECDWVPYWAGLKIDPNANPLTREILPSVCRENDPTRPYLPSSPWFSPEAIEAAQGKDPAPFAPEQHLWGPRDYFKSDFYRTTRASFLSETGYHGCPNASSIRRFIPQDHLWPCRENPVWYYHASNPFFPDSPCQNFRVDIMGEQILEFFGFEPDNLETFAAASQICQAEAIKYLIELFRSNPKRSGMIWWNLIDCWPQFSDSVVDYYGGRKLAAHIIRRVQQPVLVMVSEATAWERRILIANDSRSAASGSWRVRDAESGELFSSGRFSAAAGTIAEASRHRVSTTRRQLLLIDWELDDGTHGVNHFVAGYPRFDFKQFRDVWLPAIAAQDGSFDPATVGR